jgi:hypothetical protein
MTQTHSASLISITPKAEDQIAYCARVSNPKNQENYDTAPRLLGIALLTTIGLRLRWLTWWW